MSNNNFALVMDDSVSMRQYVSSVLRQDGCVGQILEAENPDSALRLLQEQKGSLQFIVSDWNMPGMPLAEFLESIQSQPRLAGAPILLLTAEDELRAKAVAESVGAAAVLTKPFDPERLLGLAMLVTGAADRRAAERITPFISCEVDVGFSKGQEPISADVVNISDSGILLCAPVPLYGPSFVYDVATLVLRSVTGEVINVYAQVMRIEADKEYHDADKRVLMAFEYRNINDDIRKSLRKFQKMNDAGQVSAINN